MLKHRIILIVCALLMPRWGRTDDSTQEFYVGECLGGDTYETSVNPGDHSGYHDWICSNGCGATWDRGFDVTLRTDDLACRLEGTGLHPAPAPYVPATPSTRHPAPWDTGPSAVPSFHIDHGPMDALAAREAAWSAAHQPDLGDMIAKAHHAVEIRQHNVAQDKAASDRKSSAESSAASARSSQEYENSQKKAKAEVEAERARQLRLTNAFLGAQKLSEALIRAGEYLSIVQMKQKAVDALKVSFEATATLSADITTDIKEAAVKLELLRTQLESGIPVINDAAFSQQVHEAIDEVEPSPPTPEETKTSATAIVSNLARLEQFDSSHDWLSQVGPSAAVKMHLDAARPAIIARCGTDAACLLRLKAAEAIVTGLQQTSPMSDQATADAQAAGVVSVLDDLLQFHPEAGARAAADAFLSGPMVNPLDIEDAEVRAYVEGLRDARFAQQGALGSGANYGVDLARGPTTGLLKPTIEHMETPPGAPGWDDLTAAVAAYQQAAASLDGLAVVQEPQRMALSAAELLLHLADAHFSAGSTQQGRETLSRANSCLSLVMDFIPGVSLAKDLISLFRGIEPITGEVLSKHEMGWIAASIFVPGSIKAAGREGWRVTKIFRKVIMGGDKRAEKISSLIKAADMHRANFGTALDALVERREFRQIARGWGIGKNGADQLLNHLIGKDFPRLAAIEKRSGLHPGSLSNSLTKKSLDSLKTATKEFDRLARRIRKEGIVRPSADGKTKYYFFKGEVKVDDGLMLIEFDGLFQTIMPRDFNGWKRLTKNV